MFSFASQTHPTLQSFQALSRSLGCLDGEDATSLSMLYADERINSITDYFTGLRYSNFFPSIGINNTNRVIT